MLSNKASDFKNIRTGEPDALLAGIWRQVMRDYEMDISRLDDLVSEFARKMTFMDTEKQLQYRGNVISDLTSEKMSWRTFLRGIRAIGVVEMDFCLVLHHLRFATEHSMLIQFPDPSVDVDFVPKGESKPPTELHVFYMAIMRDLGISNDTINKLITRYMGRMRVPITPRNKTSARGNIKKELWMERLSWKNFVRGLNFLEVTKFEIELRLTFKKSNSTHRRVIVINDADDLMIELLALAKEGICDADPAIDCPPGLGEDSQGTPPVHGEIPEGTGGDGGVRSTTGESPQNTADA